MLSISLRAHDLALKSLSNVTYPSQEAALDGYLKEYNKFFKALYDEAKNSTYGY